MPPQHLDSRPRQGAQLEPNKHENLFQLFAARVLFGEVHDGELGGRQVVEDHSQVAEDSAQCQLVELW